MAFDMLNFYGNIQAFKNCSNVGCSGYYLDILLTKNSSKKMLLEIHFLSKDIAALFTYLYCLVFKLGGNLKE